MVIILKKSQTLPYKDGPEPQKTSPVKLIQLRDLVADCIATEPFQSSGFEWAKHSQDWWTTKLSFSVETLRRYISNPPFVRECMLDPETGKKVTLIRIGEPGPKTKKHIQNTLAKIWFAKTGRRIVGAQYGHLGGLADHWGEKAEEIFKLVLQDVPAFMACSKIEIAKLGDAGKVRYFNEFPPTSYILRFHDAGTQMYLMKMQEKFSSKTAKPGALHWI